MTIFTQSDIILATIGLIGVTSTAVILTYAFARNKTGNGRYQ
jgi:hypothetical protein